MSHVLIVAPFVTFPGEPGANRFVAIARRLGQSHRVTLLTSRFCHITKSHRSATPHLEGVDAVVLLDEPGYATNVSPGRYFSHAAFCRNFADWLAQAPEADLVYSAFPLIETNLILARHLETRAAPLVIDVQDIWPEAIAGPLKLFKGAAGRAVLAPLTARANRAYRSADALVAVSQTYLDRANLRALPQACAEVVPIGADRLWFDPDSPARPRPPQDPLHAVYLGTLAGSYDLETLVRAAALTPAARIEIIGTGPHEARLKALAQQVGAPVTFCGALPYAEAMSRLSRADVALNAIAGSALQSITNKLSDYLCAGLPILSSQQNPEVQALLARGGGISYLPGDAAGLAQALDRLAKAPELLVQMGAVNRALAQESFLRSRSYERIAALVARLLASGKGGCGGGA